jgi:DNA-binding GntR family transcriptional regulator
MERLAIGRTPTREALRRLAQEKLVEVFPRRGIFVTSVEIHDLGAISEVRLVLESEAARLAAERATPADLEELAALVDELDRLEALDQRVLIELDERIHRAIYRAARNPFLEAALEQHYLLSLRIWHLALDRAQELEDAVQEHRALLVAIIGGKRNEAERLMGEHVAGFEAAMRRVFS